MNNSYENNEIHLNNVKKANEVKESAIALIIVGFVGLIFIGLIIFGVINIHLNSIGKCIIGSVMGIFSLFLIVTGFFSINSFKNLLNKTDNEDRITEEITRWYKNELSKDKIDSILIKTGISIDESSKEELFFPRYELIKKILENKFLNLDEKYKEQLCEIIYQELYEEE